MVYSKVEAAVVIEGIIGFSEHALVSDSTPVLDLDPETTDMPI